MDPCTHANAETETFWGVQDNGDEAEDVIVGETQWCPQCGAFRKRGGYDGEWKLPDWPDWRLPAANL